MPIISDEEAIDRYLRADREIADSDTSLSIGVDNSDGMPFLSLAVDGLTNYSEVRAGMIDPAPAASAANDELVGETADMTAAADSMSNSAEESGANAWSGIKRYFGF